MSKLLNKVIKDYKKHEDKAYSLLYTLVDLVPTEYMDRIDYADDFNHTLDIGAIRIGNLDDITDIYEDTKEDEINAIKFEVLDTNTGEVYETKRIVFYFNENKCLLCKDEGWVRNENYIGLVPFEEDDVPM